MPDKVPVTATATEKEQPAAAATVAIGNQPATSSSLSLTPDETFEKIMQKFRTANSLGVNDKQQIVYNGRPVANSNIVALLDYVVRPNPVANTGSINGGEPVGFSQFISALSDANVPSEWLNNHGKEKVESLYKFRQLATPKLSGRRRIKTPATPKKSKGQTGSGIRGEWLCL
jgi:hypothetical protein